MNIRKFFSWVMLFALITGTVFMPAIAATKSFELNTRSQTLEKIQPASPQAPTDRHTVCASGCDYSSIQDAIDAAINGDTIDLAGETYTEVITIDKSILLAGHGIDSTIVQANVISFTTSTPVISISGDIEVEIINLTVQNGGRGIYSSESNLSINNSKITNNGYGGGLYAENGKTTINSSTFVNNYANDNGGGIYNRGAMTITNSTIQDNNTNGGGGGIFSMSNLFIDNSKISYNNAQGIGGGIRVFNSSTYITQSEIIGNSAANNAGGIYSTGLLTITYSTIQDNNTNGSGGGIYNSNFGASMLLNRCTVVGNHSYKDGGGIYNTYGTLTVTNSTISGNQAKPEFQESYGGGIYRHSDGSVLIFNSTVTKNSASKGSGLWGGATTYGSIIANQISGIDCEYGTIISQGYNIDSDGSCLDGSINTDIPNTNPLIGHLANNGGPTWTHALLPGSPAIDAIPVAECDAATDQRGVSRPQGSGCDIGAYEETNYSDYIFLPLVLR